MYVCWITFDLEIDVSTNTELIARLRDTASKGVSVWGDLQIEAAKELEIVTAEREAYASAIDRMQSAIDALTAERDGLQAQLAAAQGQEPAGYFVPESWDQLGKVTEWAQAIARHGQPLYAAPIPQQPAPSVPEGRNPLTLDEVEALTAMVYGAPWSRNYCEGLLDVLAMYDELRITGQRPVDPAAPQPKEK